MKRTISAIAIMVAVSLAGRADVARTPSQFDEKSGGAPVQMALKIMERAADLERSLQNEIRQAYQEQKNFAKDAEVTAKKKKLEQDLAEAGGQLTSISQLLNKTAAQVSRGQGTVSAQSMSLQSVMDSLKDFQAKLTGWTRDNRKAGGGWLDPANLESLRKQIARIKDEAARLRRTLEGRTPAATPRQFSLTVGGIPVTLSLGSGRLSLTAAGQEPAKTVSVAVADGKVSRTELIRALRSLGVSQDATLKELTAVEARLKELFGLELSTSSP